MVGIAAIFFREMENGRTSPSTLKLFSGDMRRVAHSTDLRGVASFANGSWFFSRLNG